MSSKESQYSIDFSALDPDSVTSSSTPQHHQRTNRGASAAIQGRTGLDRAMDNHLDQSQKPGESAASSPTKYSIHLSVLEPNTATSTPVAQRHVTHIKSDDIEGPSDFTQNIAFWLNRPANLKSKTSTAADHGPTSDRMSEVCASNQPPTAHHDGSASRDYMRPSVEDYNSPLPPPLQRRTSTISSSDGSPSRKDSQVHQDHLVEQLALLELRCQQLQTTNKELESELQEQKLARQRDENKRENARLMLAKNEARLSQEVQRLEARLESSTLEIRQLNEQLRVSLRPGSIARQEAGEETRQADDVNALSRETMRDLEHELSEVRSARDADKRTWKTKEDRLVQDSSAQVQRFERQRERLEELEDRLAAELEQREKLKIESQTTQQKLAQQGLKWKQRALEYQQQNKQTESPKMTRNQQDDEAQRQAPQGSVNAAEQCKTQVELLQTQVNDMKRQLSTQSAQHEQDIQSLREEYDGVAKEVDDWIVNQVKAKDDSHAATRGRSERKISKQAARIQELERLYAQCGKELMLAWGREDFGPAPAGEKQKYRYKYA